MVSQNRFHSGKKRRTRMSIEFRYGKKIQQAREARAWTQEQLAIAAGVEPRTIQRLERDQTKNPETLQAIAAAFDLELDALRSKWRVAESHLVGAWLVTTFREFVDVQEAHPWHMSSRLVVAPLTEEGREQVDECVKQIFADRECFDPHETDLWDCYSPRALPPLPSKELSQRQRIFSCVRSVRAGTTWVNGGLMLTTGAALRWG